MPRFEGGTVTSLSRTSPAGGCRGFTKNFPSVTVSSCISYSVPLSFNILCIPFPKYVKIFVWVSFPVLWPSRQFWGISGPPFSQRARTISTVLIVSFLWRELLIILSLLFDLVFSVACSWLMFGDKDETGSCWINETRYCHASPL